MFWFSFCDEATPKVCFFNLSLSSPPVNGWWLQVVAGLEGSIFTQSAELFSIQVQIDFSKWAKGA